MTLKMSDGGDKAAVVDTPTYIVTPRSDEKLSSKGIQKKHVLIVVGLIIVAGLVVAGTLIGIHIVQETQKEITKFSLEFKSTTDGKNVKQEVESDPNDNVVMYHIVKDGKNVDIVNDFNKGMQVVKMQSDQGTNCIISALNRSAAVDPSNIHGLQTGSTDKKVMEAYSMSSSPITERSFLPKKAQTMCTGISVYWAYRGCTNENIESPKLHKPYENDRRRRAYWAGFYNGLPCLNACCWTYCACEVWVVESATGCQFFYGVGTCCGTVATPYCNNYYTGKEQTPGLDCTYGTPTTQTEASSTIAPITEELTTMPEGTGLSD
jgi:hypothetical protein